MSKFNSDEHYIYYCGQDSLRRNGVAIIVNKSRLGEELASQLLREEDSNSLFRKLQILFSEHASKPDSRELFTFSCNAGLSPAVSLSLNPAHPSRPVQGARTHGGFVTLCTGHLEAGSPSCTRLPNTDTFLYKMLQKLTSVYTGAFGLWPHPRGSSRISS